MKLNLNIPKLMLLGATSWLLMGVVKMGIAETIYPLSTSSLWKPRSYKDPKVEIHRLQRAIRLAPREAPYYYRFARLHARWLGQRWDKEGLGISPKDEVVFPSDQTQRLVAVAIGSFKSAIRLNPTSWEYHLGLAWFYHYLAGAKLVPTAQGLASLEMDRALALSPTHLLVRYHVAMFYLKIGMRDKATSIIRGTILLAPKETEKYLNLLQEAFGDSTFVPKIVPRTNIRDLIGFQQKLFRLKGQKERADAIEALIPVLVEANRYFSNTYDLPFAIGRSYEHAGNPNCLQWYKRAFHAAPDIPHKIEALRPMVGFHVRRQELAKALALTQGKLRTLNNPPQLLYMHSTILSKMGRSEEAIRIMEKATAYPDILSPGERRTFQGRLASLYRESRQFVKAIKVWKRMLYGPDYPLLSVEEQDRLSELIKEAKSRLREEHS